MKIPACIVVLVGFGVMGEQGIESIHHVFNDLHRSYACMRSPVERLKRIVAEHHLQICPHNITLQPSVKQKKRQ